MILYQTKDKFQEFKKEGIVLGLWSEKFIENKTKVSESYTDCLTISTSVGFREAFLKHSEER